MEKETCLLFDNEGNIRVYSLTEEEINLVEDIFCWLSPENAQFEKLTDMPFYEERKEN